MSPLARRIAGWLGLLLALAVLATLVAPPLHRGLAELGIARADRFDRTLRYVIGLPFFAFFFAVTKPWRDGRPASYGRPRAGAFLAGYGGSFAVIAAFVAAQLALGWLVFEDPLDAADARRRLAKFFVSGLVIAVVEEWFFRGWMDRRLQRVTSPFLAALTVAAVYAVLHTFSLRDGAPPAPVSTDGAWEVLGRWVGRLLDPAYALPKFVGLGLFGLILTAAYRRTRTLSASVGIHAAAVLVIYSYGALTDRVAPVTFWTGSKKLYDWPVAWIVGVLLLAWIARTPRGGALRLPEPLRQDGGVSSSA